MPVVAGGNIPLDQPSGFAFAGGPVREHGKTIDIGRPAGIGHCPRPTCELHIVMEIQEQGGIGRIGRCGAYGIGVQNGGAIGRSDPEGSGEQPGICRVGLGRDYDYVSVEGAITDFENPDHTIYGMGKLRGVPTGVERHRRQGERGARMALKDARLGGDGRHGQRRACQCQRDGCEQVEFAHNVFAFRCW